MTEARTRTTIVQELVDYLNENPDSNAAFRQSFEEVYTQYPALGLWDQLKVRSFDNYIEYMDRYVHWVPSEDGEGKNVYNHICFFYFILDRPPVRDYQSPIHPSSRSPWTWLSEWLIKYAKEMGQWMDSPGSFDPEKINSFVNNPAYRDKDVSDFYSQYPEPDDGGWKTFNKFFAREIDLDNRRKVDGLEDATVIVCPADCALGGKWRIHDESTVRFVPESELTFEVKGVPWSIRQLLDDGSSNFHSLFSGGVFTHSFLNTTNYHRLHAPVSGEVVEAKVIPGLCYLEVEVVEEPDKYGVVKPHLAMRRQMLPKKSTVVSLAGYKTELNAPNSAGYQFLQARALVLIKSAIGLVAVLPIGMAQVSSVVLSVNKGDMVKKGQEIAYFQLGGSDVVMAFQKAANVQLNQKPSDGEVFTKVRRKIGTADLVPDPYY